MQHKKRKKIYSEQLLEIHEDSKKIHPGNLRNRVRDRAEKRLLFCRLSGWKNFVPLI